MRDLAASSQNAKPAHQRIPLQKLPGPHLEQHKGVSLQLQLGACVLAVHHLVPRLQQGEQKGRTEMRDGRREQQVWKLCGPHAP